MGTEILSTSEKKLLTTHEQIIEHGARAFVDVGNALLAIKDKKLYRGQADTFEVYCKKRWGFAKSQAYRLIDSAQVIENLSPIGDVLPPDNEAQARILSAIKTPQKQADVWAKAVATAPKDKDGKPRVTAAHVRKVANEAAGKPAPKAKAKPTPQETNGHAETPAVATPSAQKPDNWEGGAESHEALPHLGKLLKSLGVSIRLWDVVKKIVTKSQEVQDIYDGIEKANKAATKIRDSLRRAAK